MESVYFLGTLFSFFVVLGLYVFQTRQGKGTKMSRQEKLAKAAREALREQIVCAHDVLSGKKPYDYDPLLKIYRCLCQYKIGQWRPYEYGIKDSITTAAMSCNSIARPEEVVKDVMRILLNCRTEEARDELCDREHLLIGFFFSVWNQDIEYLEEAEQ